MPADPLPQGIDFDAIAGLAEHDAAFELAYGPRRRPCRLWHRWVMFWGQSRGYAVCSRCREVYGA